MSIFAMIPIVCSCGCRAQHVGAFLATPAQIGSTPEEVVAISRREATPERMFQVQRRLEEQAFALQMMTPPTERRQ